MISFVRHIISCVKLLHGREKHENSSVSWCERAKQTCSLLPVCRVFSWPLCAVAALTACSVSQTQTTLYLHRQIHDMLNSQSVSAVGQIVSLHFIISMTTQRQRWSVMALDTWTNLEMTLADPVRPRDTSYQPIVKSFSWCTQLLSSAAQHQAMSQTARDDIPTTVLSISAVNCFSRLILLAWLSQQSPACN